MDPPVKPKDDSGFGGGACFPVAVIAPLDGVIHSEALPFAPAVMGCPFYGTDTPVKPGHDGIFWERWNLAHRCHRRT